MHRNAHSPSLIEGQYHTRTKNSVWEATDVSEIPCRLIDDVHEWRNELSTVPR